MNKTFYTFLLIISMVSCSFGQEVFDRERFLWAIAQVETGGRNELVGKAGERSKYQFMKATWEQYSTIPHAQASHVLPEVERVAAKHLDWIIFALRKHNYSITVENCAAIWNAGWGNFRKGYRPKKYIDKVRRVY